MRPTDLDDLTPVEPDDASLARVQARSVSFRRRRGYQRFAGAVTGVLVVALAVGIALTRVDTTTSRVTTTIPTATTTTTTTIAPTPPAITPDALVGTWRPVSVADYSGALTSPPLIEPPALRFGDYAWSASDGCNDTSGGTYQLGPDGAIKFRGGMTTQVACALSVPFPSATTRLALDGGRLTFFADDGHQIAQYERAKIRARVELPSQTMEAGSTMTGHVVVENDTGFPVRATQCHGYFAVVLTSPDVVAEGGFPACAEGITFPVGESTYPVTIPATYLACTSGAPQGSTPACLANNGPPPLPAGDYEAKLLQIGDVVSIPPPMKVRVTPAVSSP